MKKQYWILNNDNNVIQSYNGEKQVGEIGSGYCFNNNNFDFGDYIVFDDTINDYRQKLLLYLIKREDEIIAIHNKEKDKYIKMLSEK